MSASRDQRARHRSGPFRTPRWRNPWVAGSLAFLLMLALGADRTVALRPPGSVSQNAERQSARDDWVTDQFLRQFRSLRDDTAKRRALATEVVTAATRNSLDPDLLFALVAVESGFDRTAVSPKGARGLGQVMFPTARAVAPALVRRPKDLFDARRNLAVTASHLTSLLSEGGGDLRAALTMYHAGPGGRHLPKRRDDGYVGLICTYYASLKVRRRFGSMMAMAAEASGPPDD